VTGRPGDDLLEVADLTVEVPTPPLGDLATVVDGVTFTVRRGEAVALLGESGAGKSMTTLALLRLLPEGARSRGRIALGGTDLAALDERSMQRVRGGRIGLVFQEPGAALDPMYSALWHVVDAVKLARSLGGREAREAARAMLARVGFPTDRHDAYPHELSGGMKQRLMIAVALAGEPELLVADEPTTALDVIAAAHVRALLDDLRRQRDLALLVISHDVAMVAELAHRVVVMYAGQVVEQGPTREVLDAPRHPYTRALLDCLPSLGAGAEPRPRRRLAVIPQGDGSAAAGCRFAPRCAGSRAACHDAVPPLAGGPEHEARCLFPLEPGGSP